MKHNFMKTAVYTTLMSSAFQNILQNPNPSDHLLELLFTNQNVLSTNNSPNTE